MALLLKPCIQILIFSSEMLQEFHQSRSQAGCETRLISRVSSFQIFQGRDFFGLRRLHTGNPFLKSMGKLEVDKVRKVIRRLSSKVSNLGGLKIRKEKKIAKITLFDFLVFMVWLFSLFVKMMFGHFEREAHLGKDRPEWAHLCPELSPGHQIGS